MLIWPLKLAHVTAMQRKNRLFCVVAESLCGATVSLGDLLSLKDTVLDTHFCKSTMTIIK